MAGMAAITTKYRTMEKEKVFSRLLVVFLAETTLFFSNRGERGAKSEVLFCTGISLMTAPTGSDKDPSRMHLIH